MVDAQSREIELVLLLSLPAPRPEEVDRMLELLNTALDWGQVLGTLTVHRLLGVAWHNIARYAMRHRQTLRSAYFVKSLKVNAAGQRITAQEQIAGTAAVQRALEGAGVRSAVLKGGAVAVMAYEDPGMRLFHDNDLLVDRERLPEAVAVLERLGYSQGSWDYETGAVKPAPRRQVMFMALHSHQTFPYMKATPEAAALECHRLDIHFSIDLMTGNRSDAAVAELLDGRTERGGLSVAAPLDMILFTCVHYAREAAHRNEVLMLKDLVLNKLVDIVALVAAGYSGDLPARAQQLGFAREVYFGLHHADALFPGRIPADLLDRLRPDDLGYLDEVTDGGTVVHRWRTPISERMFDLGRLHELGGELAIPVLGSVPR